MSCSDHRLQPVRVNGYRKHQQSYQSLRSEICSIKIHVGSDPIFYIYLKNLLTFSKIFNTVGRYGPFDWLVEDLPDRQVPYIKVVRCFK